MKLARARVQGNCSGATTRAADVASALPALAEAAGDACVLEVGEAGLMQWPGGSSANTTADVWLHGIHVHASSGTSKLVSLVRTGSAGSSPPLTAWLSSVTLQGGSVALSAANDTAVYAAGAPLTSVYHLRLHSAIVGQPHSPSVTVRHFGMFPRSTFGQGPGYLLSFLPWWSALSVSNACALLDAMPAPYA